MANLILKLKKNEKSLEQELIIDYESDSDALPFEHEEDHRVIVRRLLAGNAFDEAELLVINRGAESPEDNQEENLSSVTEQTALKLKQ